MQTVERSIRFGYAVTVDGWHLSEREIDEVVCRIIGREAVRCPRVIAPPSSPQQLLARMVLVLAEHKLDGGFIHEMLSDDYYCATIVVEARRDKPH